MFLVFKTSRFRIFTFISMILLFVGGIIYGFSTKDAISRQVMPQKNIDYNNIETNDDIIKVLKEFGWEVDKTPIETVTVDIPSEFDEVYNNYNKLQEEVGLDLNEYRGKSVQRYTYNLLNYPKDVGKQQVRVNVLVFNQKIIAGDVMTVALGGFMHSLKMPVD